MLSPKLSAALAAQRRQVTKQINPFGFMHGYEITVLD